MLAALLATATTGMAQLPFLLEPDTPRSPTRDDFEKAVKAYHGMLQFLSGIAELTDSVQPAQPSIGSIQPPDADYSTPRTFDFKNESLSRAFRSLARQAKKNVIIEDGLSRPITFRMENKTPAEMIDILCVAERLQMDERNGVYYIHFPRPFHTRRAETIAESTKEVFQAYVSNGFTKGEATELILRFPDGFAQGLEEAQASRKEASKTASESKIDRTPTAPSIKPQRKTSPKNRVGPKINEQRTVHEFRGEEISSVLRKLGREANMDIFVRDDVQGSITLRLEDKTAREVFDTIVFSNNCAIDEVNGVYLVRNAASDQKEAAQRTVRPAKLMFDAYRAKGFTREEALKLMLRLPAGASLRFVYPDLPPGMQGR